MGTAGIRAGTGGRSGTKAASGGPGLLTAAAGCVLGLTVTVWWTVGDLSSPMPPGTTLDYLVRPPAIDPRAERVIGIAAALTTAITLALLAYASRHRRFDPRWWAALVPALAAGAVVGLGWRMVTAGGIGANIGGGLAIIFGGPVVALLILWTAGWSIHVLRSRRRARAAPSPSV